MNLNNPYAPPAAPQTPFAGPPAGGPWSPGAWTPTQVLEQAWERFKVYWGVLIGSVLIAGLIVILLQSAIMVPISMLGVLTPQRGQHDLPAASIPILFGAYFFAFLCFVFFQGGFIAMCVKVARGDSPSIGDLFSGGRWLFRMLGAQILTMLIVWLGSILFVVPGLIAAFLLFFTPYFIVDQNMGPIQAMGASFRATSANVGNLLVLALLSWLINLAGVLACGVGMFVSMSVVYIAASLAYLYISGRMGPGSTPGFGGPPGGGYAPPGPYGGPPPGPPGGYGGPPAGGYVPPGPYGGPPAGGYGGGYGGPAGGGYGPTGGR